MNWVLNIESTVYSIVEAKAYPDIVAEFPDVYFTTLDDLGEKPSFPTVYIHAMQNSENGADLEGLGTNGVLASFEAVVTVNTNQQDAKKVMSVVFDAFKSIRFGCQMMPIITRSNNLYVATARFRRMIGANDNLNL